MFTGRDSVRAGLPLVTIAAVTVHIQSKHIVWICRREQIFIVSCQSFLSIPCVLLSLIRTASKLTNYVYRRI